MNRCPKCGSPQPVLEGILVAGELVGSRCKKCGWQGKDRLGSHQPKKAMINVKPEIIQALIGFLLVQYNQSMTRTTYGHEIEIQILDAWEYINRRLVGTSIVEVERIFDELEEVGIMRNGSLLVTGSIDPHNKSKTQHH
ncbi:MAG: hypothetical protein V3T99_03410 [Nitrososphaerales archaeon]